MMIPHTHANQQQALKMQGVFVKIEPGDFQNLVYRDDSLLIVISKSGLFSERHLYLTSYKGFVFYCKSKEEISIPVKNEKIFSSSVTLPIM